MGQRTGRPDNILPALKGTYLRQRQPVLPYRLFPHIERRSFLTYHETESLDTMIQRKRKQLNCPVIINHLRLLHGQRHIIDMEKQALTEI